MSRPFRAGDGVALSFPGLQPGAGMSRPFRAGDGAFEKGLKGSDIPAQAEGLGKIPEKLKISPEGAQHKLVCAWLVLDSPRFDV